jgi:DNA-binding NtrC family response regulator
VIKSALNLAQGGRIDIGCLPPYLHKPSTGRSHDASPTSKSIATLAQLEKEHILKVYRLLKQNKAECARMLGIGINTLRRKLSFYGIN